MYSSDGNSYPAKETSSSHSPSKKSGYFVAPGLLLLITCFLNSFGFAILLSNEEEEEEEEEKAFDPSLSNAPSLPPSENARASPPPLTAAAKDVAHSAIDKDDDDVNNTVLLDALSSFHFLFFFFSSSSSPVSSSEEEEEEELRQKRRAIPGVLTTSECRRRRRCRGRKAAGARLVRVVAVVVVVAIYPAYYFAWYSGAFFSPGKRGIKSHARKRKSSRSADDIAREHTRTIIFSAQRRRKPRSLVTKRNALSFDVRVRFWRDDDVREQRQKQRKQFSSHRSMATPSLGDARRARELSKSLGGVRRVLLLDDVEER